MAWTTIPIISVREERDKWPITFSITDFQSQIFTIREQLSTINYKGHFHAKIELCRMSSRLMGLHTKLLLIMMVTIVSGMNSDLKNA